MSKAHKVTITCSPPPAPDAYERVIGGLRNVADYAGHIGADVESAVLKLLSSVERRKHERGAA